MTNNIVLQNQSKVYKSELSIVSVGLYKFQGVYIPELDRFGVTLPKLANVFPTFQDSKGQVSQKLKHMLGKECRTHKTRTKGQKKYTLCVLLEDFLEVLKALKEKGDTVAVKMIDNLIGLSLQQLFSDSFGIKFEAEDSYKWLANRQTHRKAFHPLYISWLKADGIIEGWQHASEVNRLKLILKLPLVTIDLYDHTQLCNINSSEYAYDGLRRAGLSHQKALEILSV